MLTHDTCRRVQIEPYCVFCRHDIKTFRGIKGSGGKTIEEAIHGRTWETDVLCCEHSSDLTRFTDNG